MTLKKKLALGLGFLFLIIFVLVFFYAYYVGKLSEDAGNILKDNYKSLVYTRNMISALDDMRTAVSRIVFNPADDQKPSVFDLNLYEAGRAQFENNFKSEKANITEINEKEYVDTVDQGYQLFAGLGQRLVKGEGGRALYFNEYQPAFEKLKSAISNINDINMEAVERKSQTAKHDSSRIIDIMAVVGILCLILAFGYFWYFPVYISSSISLLSERMKGLLRKSGLTLDIRTNDESFIILQAINLLENKMEAKGGSKAPETGDQAR